MSTWNNLDTLESFKELSNVKKVNLVEAMTGENGCLLYTSPSPRD